MNTNVRSFTQCVYHSKKYKKGYFISQYVDDFCPENVLIYYIDEIVLIPDCDSVHLVCKRINVERYYKHYKAYVFNDSDEQNEYVIVDIANLSGPPINFHRTARGLKMIRPKQFS